ncbi:MAG: DegT/DnrJ/EryC1/StrS family aminotransferase [Syntrophobacterales bacterium]|jgi:dTDP-4-amino-4,6-dideoxygalactose transaminase|nr:DegT/DnrJ/EryC1/StrS family aminotransferase [Syntrophobacterales bacterium]
MRIPFEPEYRRRYFQLLEEVFDSNFWSDGRMLQEFEAEFGAYAGVPARAVANGGTGLLAILDYLDVRDQDVVVPANTFWATAQAAKKAGAWVIYADCNREDLCLSLEDLKRKVTSRTKAVIVVHIGGHIAFQIEDIADFCRDRGIHLIEDCAHVHGGWWHGKTGGHYGFAGAYSFYATKTMPLGEGGMVVSRDAGFLEWLERYRNYGKEIVNGKVTYPLKSGFNYRMNEVTAALGIIQLKRLPLILAEKRALAAKYDRIFANRLKFPPGMISGYYKYIVFDYPQLKMQTGQVFGLGDLGPVIEGVEADVPNSYWIAAHHQCPPIYYGWEHAQKEVAELREVLLEDG